MLKQHEYYVYYDGNAVMARMGNQAPVIAETLGSVQAAHDRVQEIVNPTRLKASDFNEQDSLKRDKGFHSESFQMNISKNCEAFVKAAYAKKKK